MTVRHPWGEHWPQLHKCPHMHIECIKCPELQYVTEIGRVGIHGAWRARVPIVKLVTSLLIF